ncbi:histidine phosphatase family protein [Methylocystis sp. WRRC1]|uniref:histidine phosphatase family protein n=1 Tax=Methylocystis sp. WRRC1 TaxID=1732014 RepID=UPI001D134F86|nr:histidine phosphatase family protein [Methylocystis sp. WRRC1]MCC3245651.1 histidine phosphatase family protein [Methylocystis sp. WRRC1]
MPRTLLCLARHGETNWNIERRFQGQFDIALNARGRAQAQALARELDEKHFDRVYSSDLRRALTTAEAVAEGRGLKIRTVPELREKNDGVWQGHTHAEVQVIYEDIYPHYLSRKASFAAPDGETLEQFRERVAAALTAIARENEGRTVLVVAHAGVLDIAWRLATGKRLDEKREYPVLNATPNWIAYEDGKWSLVDWARPEGRPEIAAPWDGSKLPRREAARALIVETGGRALLMQYAGGLSPHFLELGHHHFWATPGGALKEGESFTAALRREVYEETGLVVSGDPGPVVATREFPMELGEDWHQAVERYYLIRTEEFAPAPQGQTEEEKTHTLGWRWWSPEEIAASRELIFPEGLEALLRKVMS